MNKHLKNNIYLNKMHINFLMVAHHQIPFNKKKKLVFKEFKMNKNN